MLLVHTLSYKHTHTPHCVGANQCSIMTRVFLLLVSILAVAYGPTAVVGYPEGARSESCYLMNVNHTDNFGRARPSRDCGPDCDHSLEVLGAVVSGSNRTRIEGNGSVTTYECETVYESKFRTGDIESEFCLISRCVFLTEISLVPRLTRRSKSGIHSLRMCIISTQILGAVVK